MARRSRRSWKVLESRSPEPSSSRSATMLPTPGLSAGSCVAPPPKAYSIAISGTVASCTNQASIPPGETRRWIFAAACDGVDVSAISIRPAANINAARRGEARPGGSFLECITNASPRVSARFLDQIAGHRTFLVEPFLRGVANLFGGDGANAVRPASDVVDAKAGGECRAVPARQRRLVVLGIDRSGDELGLDALEILGGHRVLSDIRYHAVDRPARFARTRRRVSAPPRS